MSIELPKDAEGREIPLDTAILYGNIAGEECRVACFNFSPGTGRWTVEVERRGDSGTYVTEGFTLVPPDSWEKLEEDLNSGANAKTFQSCHYAHCNELTCEKCRFYADSDGRCERNAFADIALRIRKLRGEGE